MQAKLKKFVVATNDKVNNYIHDDVAFSILSKLPLKSLKRFECVCKSWFLLFDNPNFMSMYRINFLSKYPSYDDNTSLILLLNMHEQLYYLSGKRFENTVKSDRPNPIPNLIPGQDTYLNFIGLGSINGVLCLEDKYIDRVVLWNPAIKEFNLIPQSPFESFSPPATLNFKATVVFEADINLHGFGYDYVRDDYKLIRRICICPLFPDYPDFLIDCPSHIDVSLMRDKSLDPFWEIYSLRSNSWRKLDVDMPFCDKITCTFGTLRVYMDGVCHWLHFDRGNNYVGACLVSFNLINEVIINTPIPSFLGVVWTEWLGLNSSLALISYHKDTTTFHISVLGELGVKESWIKLFIIGPLPCVEIPIGVGKMGELFFRKKDYELAWYDLNTKTIEELGGFKGNRYNRKGQIVIYDKSFLSIGAVSK